MKKGILIIVIVGIAIFLWWTLSPLLINKEVRDELDPDIEAALNASGDLPRSTTEAENGNGARLQHDTDGAAQTSTPTELPRTHITGPFAITGTGGHPATGDVEIIYSPEETLVRYKDYDGTNGPDLYVYLSKDLEAKDYISLGRAKGNQGTLIYGVPLEIDVSEYKYVLTWCRAFGVLFDYAEIQ